MAKVAALMVTEMVTARSTETVAEVARRMADNKIGAVLVVDGNDIKGLFSERDLLNRVVADFRNPETTKLEHVCTKDIVTIDVKAPVKAVLEIFREKKFRHLPVVDGGKPVGILSVRDFLEYLVGGLESYIDDMRYKRELAEGVDPYDHIGGSYGK